MGAPFKRQRDGTIAVTLSEIEVDAIARLAGEIQEVLDDPDAGGSTRLFPPGFTDDPVREASFHDMTHGDLVDRKRAAAERVRSTLAGGTRKRGRWTGDLDDEASAAWLTMFNDVRLVLGERIGVTEAMEHRVLPADDPRAPAHNMYLYLSGLLEQLIDALTPGLPPGIDDRPNEGDDGYQR